MEKILLYLQEAGLLGLEAGRRKPSVSNSVVLAFHFLFLFLSGYHFLLSTFLAWLSSLYIYITDKGRPIISDFISLSSSYIHLDGLNPNS